ncbi:Alpha/Beta hydrolase protein [Mycena albidolilacea]|uniref:Carboxylic ester hydrolase n=1 Tax=Mycena albidolilacea TaxID=1033008 RepID=A0AAD7EEQ5_9AGAR|nr:Alpha/Beta hydrolase protein [Mycena albidolilacea]
MLPSFLVALSILLRNDFAAAEPPIVSLSYGTFQGLTEGNLTKFLGVPFGQAYVQPALISSMIRVEVFTLHSGRFEVPRAPGQLQGVQNATTLGPACPQQALSLLPVPFVPGKYPISEACLMLDILSPTTLNSNSNAPVFVWIFGGGFEVGNSRDIDVSPVVERSIDTDEPVIVVTPNYRVSAFGFLAGKEVDAAGITNLGIRDQIFALRWVQKHIAAFGGDPDRVVVGGPSAGAISTSLLLLSNKQNSNALFRGAFMESGAPWTLPSVADSDLQSTYDSLVIANNCSAASDSLECLRRIPFESIMATVNRTLDIFSYRSLSLFWTPYIDGDVISRDPLVSVSQGLYATIPLMIGNADDEGTSFSFSNQNITYVHPVVAGKFPESAQERMQTQIGHLYPEDPTQGSPFGTGTAYQLTPEYKWLAAFQGDFAFVGPRRSFLEKASVTQDAWSWLSKREKDTPFGAFHGSDVALWFPNNTTGETFAVDALSKYFAHHQLNQVNKNSMKSTSSIH